jgi:hypothetical protein
MRQEEGKEFEVGGVMALEDVWRSGDPDDPNDD